VSVATLSLNDSFARFVSSHWQFWHWPSVSAHRDDTRIPHARPVYAYTAVLWHLTVHSNPHHFRQISIHHAAGYTTTCHSQCALYCWTSLNSLCYSIVYHYNGVQRYEQFLQVGQLHRALILLGLALLSSEHLCVFGLYGAIYRVGQKTGLFLRSHTFATTDDRKACNVKSFRILSRMKCIICISVQLNILYLICINRQYPQNCIEFANDAWVLLNFHSKYCKTRTISNTCA